MSEPQPASASPTSGLHSREKRSIRFVVSSASGGPPIKSVEFYGLDKARLCAWALALDGKSVEITKLLYDITQVPAKAVGSTVIERWNERSAFIFLNTPLRGA